MNKNSKGSTQFLVILVLSFFLIVGIGYWAYKNGQTEINLQQTPSQTLTPTPSTTVTPVKKITPTPDPTTVGWNIYRNNKYRIELKYPQDWTVEETTPTVTYFIGPTKGPDPIVGYIHFYTNLEEAINDMGNQFEQKNVIRREITINGLKALRVTATTPEITSWSTTSVIINGEKYIYRINMAGDTRPQYANIEQKILSTFKFLD